MEKTEPKIKPQYEIQSCNSQSQPVEDNWKAHLSGFSSAKAVVWYYDQIEFLDIKGEWTGREESEIVRLRIFDADKELHLWRRGDKLVGRLRTDGVGEETKYIKTDQLLNGTQISGSNGNITLSEDKGVSYSLPFTLDDFTTNGRIALTTRNYIGHSDIGQAGFVDSRFVKFVIV